MAALRCTLQPLAQAQVTAPVAWLCKGFEAAPPGRTQALGLMAHEVCAQVAPSLLCGVLERPQLCPGSGPRPAHLPGGGQLRMPPCADACRQAFHSPALRVYANDDIVGVEVGGAVKNVHGHCHRPVRWPGAGPERPRSLAHAGLGRDDPPGRGPGRAGPTPLWACPAWVTWC